MRALMGTEFDVHWRDKPLVVVDVGARGGVSERWSPARPNLCMVAFEPDPAECRRLQATAADPAVRYLPTALADSAGEVRLNATRNGDTASVLEPNREFIDKFPEAERFDVVSVVSVPSNTLDAAMVEAGICGVDALKIDTQGSELQILGGARAVARDAFSLEIETEFDRLYVGQPLFRDIDAFADASGFRLFDLQCRRWKRTRGIEVGGPKGQVVFADALYLRREASWFEVLDDAGKDAASRLLHALAICLLHGYGTMRSQSWTTVGRFSPTPSEGVSSERCALIAGRANVRVRGIGIFVNRLRDGRRARSWVPPLGDKRQALGQ